MMDLNKILEKLEKNKKENLKDFNDRILIIDGMNMLIRVFSCFPTTNENGLHIGGIVGTLKSIGNVVRKFKPSRCIFVMDGKGGSVRRKKIFPEYKNKRHVRSRLNRLYDFNEGPETESEALIRQAVRLLHYLSLFPITTIVMEDIEADDTISVLVDLINKNHPESEAVIVSTDKDFLQLTTDKVSVYNPVRKVLFNKQLVIDEYGIIPENMPIFRAIEGDQSDCIPGIKGIGKVTLKKNFPLLYESNVIDTNAIIEYAQLNYEANKTYQKVCDGKDILERNYKLMQLTVPSISAQKILQIKELFYEKPHKMNMYKFRRLVSDDMIGANVFKDHWLLSFSFLDMFAY